MHASWTHELRESLGLAGVSQIWGDKPAWYFWITGAPCVYSLHYESDSLDAAGAADAARGLLSIKCYPRPGTPTFQSFSREEQALVASDVFDETGTPRFEFLDRIPPPLFHAATIEYALSPDDTWALLTFESLDIMRTRYEVPAALRNALLDKTHTWSAGEIARKVSAWDLGFGLFDRLVCLHAYHHKARPIRVVHAAAPGFEVVYDRNLTYRCDEVADVSSLSLGVLLVREPHERFPEADALIEAECGDASRKVIFDETFSCGYASHSLTRVSRFPFLNRQWWTIADANYTSRLTSTCGCS